MTISDSQFMRIAKIVSESSKANRLKVGSVIVKDNRIISTGYNGTPPGLPNNCEDENGQTRPEVIHSESNAIFYAAKNGGSVANATMYCTTACCVNCATAIIASGITSFKYEHDYRDDTGLYLLRAANVTVTKVKQDDTQL